MTRTVDLTGVPALTLLNPWAHLVAHHGKDVENRTWMPPERVHRLLIHAGKGWDDGTAAWVYDEFGIDVSGVQPSAVVAVADLAFACNASRFSTQLRCGCGRWAAAGEYHWALANVVTLPEPVPCRGRQGLWRPEPADLWAVERQLAAVGQ